MEKLPTVPFGEDSLEAREEDDLADGTPAPDARDDWCPELRETLCQALAAWVDLGSPELDANISDLEHRHGGTVYSELIYLLSHLRFSRDEAKRYWREILDHRASLERRLDGFVDLRVALASYFIQVNRKLENPKMIELKLFERTRAQAYRDELTGLHNYRFFMESLAQETLRARRYNAPLSLVMVDIDHFKHYNDRNGHEAGNGVLKSVGALLAEALRKEDLTARYGGEEYALVLPATPKTGARLVCERARESIERYPFPHGDAQPSGRLTVSMGIATFPADADRTGGLVRAADRALYAAKAGGKNRVELYGRSCRSFQRLGAALPGRLRATDSPPCSLTTVDVSEGGFLVRTMRKLLPGMLVDVRLDLPGGRGEITASGRVVECNEVERGAFEVRVRIVDIEAPDRLALAAYLAEHRPSDEADPADDALSPD